jgi:hypothetical protein
MDYTQYPAWAGGFEERSGQMSSPIRLTAGKQCKFEISHVGGGGNDLTDVAWDIPGIANQAIISGRFLSPP